MEQTTPKTRKQRTPRKAEDITKGALALSLPEKVALIKTLTEDVKAEVEQRKIQRVL